MVVTEPCGACHTPDYPEQHDCDLPQRRAIGDFPGNQ
jgi:hypothetical protein